MVKPTKLTAGICIFVMVAIGVVTVVLAIYSIFFKPLTPNDDWYKPHVAQSSIGEITVVQSHFYTLDENSYIEIDDSRIYKTPLEELIDDNRINSGESDDYFRFEYNGERYLLLFGEAASLYYNSDLNTKPVFIEKLNFVVVK